VNTSKVREAFGLLKEAMIEESPPSVEDWANFGEAIKEALDDNYDIRSVLESRVRNANWRLPAIRLWQIKHKIGL